MDHTKVTRRKFLGTSLTAAGAAMIGPGILAGCGDGAGGGASDEIRVGSIQDLTGPISQYGSQQFQGVKLAVNKINEDGGLLGRNLRLINYDAQSSTDRAVELAQRLIQRDQVHVINGTAASPTREAVRAITHQAQKLFFYPQGYEGGVCDKYTFLPSSTSSQQMRICIEYSLENLGNRFYVVAPDYNYGTITIGWVEHYLGEFGGELVGTELIPIPEGNFATTISRIRAARPDVVIALPTGTAQNGMISQFEAAGLKDEMHFISTIYGSGNQQFAVPPEAGEGMIVVTPYMHELDNDANRAFKKLWAEEFGAYPPITIGGTGSWVGMQLYARSVEEAGSLETDDIVAALESGFEFDSPYGPMRMHGPSHHPFLPIYIGQQNANQEFELVETFEDVPPDFEVETCDLIEDPSISRQFVPSED